MSSNSMARAFVWFSDCDSARPWLSGKLPKRALAAQICRYRGLMRELFEYRQTVLGA